MKKTYMILSAAFVLCTSTLFGAASDDFKSDAKVSAQEASYNDNQCGPWHRPISPDTFDKMANMRETRLKWLADASPSRALEELQLPFSSSTCESESVPLTRENTVVGSSEQPEKWWNKASVQDADGVRIESFFQDTDPDSLKPTASQLASRLIPWRLALALKSDTHFVGACEMVKNVLEKYEKESSMIQQATTYGLQIKRMLINISLKGSGAKICVKGAADPETFVTFFPSYTIVKEDAESLFRAPSLKRDGFIE